MTLSDNDRQDLEKIFDDLELLFKNDYIEVDKIQELSEQLKSEEAKYYLKKLLRSEPEPAFREAFFAGPHSKIAQFIGGDISPEVNVKTGVIDYMSGIGDRSILLELKPPFYKDTEKTVGGKLTKGIKLKTLKWQDRKDQILSYVQSKKEFVIITNLKNWFFFNKTTNEKNFEPFYSASLKKLKEEFVSDDLFEFLRRKERQSMSDDLDDEFFNNLKKWVEKLSNVKFDTDEKTKWEIIIGIINKFIFIRTLDDFECISMHWLKENWEFAVKRYSPMGQLKILEKFFGESIDWFKGFYDTELFEGDPLEHLNKDEDNIKLFYRAITSVLGLTYLETSFKGIIQYDFRYIDEDVLGRAYELFLAEQRHDEGIYYTRKEVTQYIVDQTIGKVCSNLLSQISHALETQNYRTAEENIKKLISFKVLDLSCGSGAFIIKAIRTLWNTYKQINLILLDLEKKQSQHETMSTSIKPSEILTKLSVLKELLGSKDGNSHELITKILLKNVYGNDLDARAIQVAKLNMWLEAIKSAPQFFRFTRPDVHKALPRLEMNLSSGDALVGLQQDLCFGILDKHKAEIQKLIKIREEYLNAPDNPEIVDQIAPIKEKIRSELDKEFVSYLKKEKIDPKSITTNILHWPLQFWHVYYDEKGDRIENEKIGFDFVLGNPPYEGTKVIVDRKDFYNKEFKKVAYGSYDIYVLFLQRGVDFLKKLGKLGFIVSNKFLVKSYGKKLIPFLCDNTHIEELMDLTKCPSVFEDALVSPVIMTSTKEKIVNKEEKETKISVIKKNDVSLIPKVKEIEKETITNDFSVEFRKYDKLVDSQTGHILLFLTGNDGKLMEKMEKDSDNLKSTCDDLRTGIMGFNYWSINPLIFEDSTLNDNDDEAKILPPSLIDNYQITWQSDTVDLYKKNLKCPKVKRRDDTVINDPTWKLYKKPKIVVRGTAQRLTAAIDYNGEYGLLVAAHAVIPKNVNDFEYVTGILNSRLLNWYHLKKLMGGQIPEGSLSYPVDFYEKIPIKKSSKYKKEISLCVKKIISLKRAYSDFFETWKEWSTKIPTIKQRSIEEILKDDEEFIANGDLKYVCFQNVSFYPSTANDDQRKQLQKKYEKISFDYDQTSSSLLLRGMDESNDWHDIFVLKLENDDLLGHMYLSFENQFKSRSQIRTINNFFEKTIVPVLLPISDRTQNVLKVVKAEYAKINTEVPGDLLDIIIKLRKHSVELDALVFQEYGLSEEESISVMSFLSIPEYYQKMILTHIDK